MYQLAEKTVIEQLQKEVLFLQRYKGTSANQNFDSGLGVLENAFPDKVFPIAAIHELLSFAPADAAATNGFIAGLLGKFMNHGGPCLWIGSKRKLFPPALKAFGIEPDRVIFVDLTRQKDILWAIEEALKCEALSAVVGEVSELTFTESRRLQLAVEQSRVTGFIHRHNPRNKNTVACLTRWQITPMPSKPEEGLPGVGFPRWHVQLLKARNGKPGIWQIEWSGGNFLHIAKPAIAVTETQIKKAG